MLFFSSLFSSRLVIINERKRVLISFLPARPPIELLRAWFLGTEVQVKWTFFYRLPIHFFLKLRSWFSTPLLPKTRREWSAEISSLKAGPNVLRDACLLLKLVCQVCFSSSPRPKQNAWSEFIPLFIASQAWLYFSSWLQFNNTIKLFLIRSLFAIC